MKLEKPLEQFTTSELVSLYNELVPPPKAVRKFSSKGVGIKRVRALLSDEPVAASKSPEPSPAAEDEADQPLPKRGGAKVPRAPKAERRSTVRVVGPKGGEPVVYRSVKVAFAELNLPMVKHQKFRKTLKQSGCETFDRYTFYTAAK